MEIKELVVQEYLDSLTEKNELNRIFPLLLESMGFEILSKPTEYLGIQEYGKDIVAIGKGEEGITSRFYFELKGGADRNITESNFHGKDGISTSLIEATYKEFISAYPQFYQLPLKVVIVHNGVVSGSTQGTLESLLQKLSKQNEHTTFERWDIHRLTQIFTKHLFGPYLLTDYQSTKTFNRVLVNLNASDNISKDFYSLLDLLLEKDEWKGYGKTVPRKWKVIFGSLKLVSFIVYTESKQYNNLNIAKRYLSLVVIRFWFWILKNKLEDDVKILKYFNQTVKFYYDVLKEYFNRTLPIAFENEGLYSENGGRYEQVGYTQRTFDYLAFYLMFIEMDKVFNKEHDSRQAKNAVLHLVNSNSVSLRPILDIHSVPIVDLLNMFISTGDLPSAKSYLSQLIQMIIFRKEKLGVLPDANNNLKNVIRFTITGNKPVYFEDSTSYLLTTILKYVGYLDMEEEYHDIQESVKKWNVMLAYFVPHSGINSISQDFIEDQENDLEEQMFSKSVNDGYQEEIRLSNERGEDIPFQEFKDKMMKNFRFQYTYRTDKAGFAFLRNLSHWFYYTPYFPDRWWTVGK